MDDEKPLELRDQLAIQILQAMLCNEDSKDFINHYFQHWNNESNNWKDSMAERAENRIRAAYKLADMMRKVRMAAFE